MPTHSTSDGILTRETQTRASDIKAKTDNRAAEGFVSWSGCYSMIRLVYFHRLEG